MSMWIYRLGRLWLVPALLLLAGAPAVSAAGADRESGPDEVTPIEEGQIPPGDERLQTLPTGQPLDMPMTGEGDEEQVTHRENQVLLNELVGTAITNHAGDELARVDSFIIDRQGRVVALVTDVGGFLGAGSRRVALAWSIVEITPGQEPRVSVEGMEREALRDAPEFAGERQDPQQQTSRDQSGQQAFVAHQQENQMSTRVLFGTEVINAEDEELGVIADLVIGRQGEIEAVIVRVDGFLGLGDKAVALDWDRFEIQRAPEDSNAYLARVGIDRQALEVAPEFVKRDGRPIGDDDAG